MNNPLISIIVPIYNVEKYLSKCIDGILNQTYKNLEIILVDDGSPDDCGRICDEYSLQDKRIKVIHKSNGGLSDARNVAIDLMNGEYVTFIDSDDFVSSDYVETLYNLIEKSKCEISVSQFIPYSVGKLIEILQPKEKTTILNVDDAVRIMFYQEYFDTSAWGKMYERNLFSSGVRYPKEALFEDLPTTYLLFLKANNIAVTNRITYYYLMREEGIQWSKFNPQKMDVIKHGEEMRKYLFSNKPHLVTALNCRLLSAYFNILMQTESNSPYESELWNEIIKLRRNVLFDYKGRRKARFACLISYLGLSIIRKIFALSKF